MNNSFRKTFRILFVLGLGLLCILFYTLYGNQPLKKPVKENPTIYDLPIINEANKYTNVIAKQDYATAKAMSNETNKNLIETNIIPKIKYWEKKINGKKIRFKSTEFERALLINDQLDNLTIYESLNFTSPVGDIGGFFLKFNIKQVGTSYQVQSSELAEKKVGASFHGEEEESF